MQRKINSPVLETRYSDIEEHQPVRIRKRKCVGLYWESEGSIVSFEGTGQHNPAPGKGPTLFTRPKRGGKRDCRDANNP